MQLNSEDFLEEANLEQIFLLRRQGLGSEGAGERTPWDLWPLIFLALTLSSVVPSLPVLLPLCLIAQQGVCPGFLSLAGSGTPHPDPLPSHHPHIPFGPSRSRASSESELDDDGPCGGDGDPGLFPFPLPRGGAQASSEESEEEGTSDDLHHPPDCHYATRPPRPQAVRTWGRDLGWGVAQLSWPTMWGGGQILCAGALPAFQGPLTLYLPSAFSSAPLGAGW